MQLISKPSALNLSGNLPKIVINAGVTEKVTAELLYNGDTILSENYVANSAGVIAIDYRELINDLLKLVVPEFTQETFDQVGAVKDFTVNLVSSFGDTNNFNFRVVKGGLSVDNFNHATFLQTNFLTWQLQQKLIKYYDPEFLTYYAAAAVKFIVKARFADGTSSAEVELASVAAGKVFTVNVNYGIVRELFPEPPVYFDVYIKSGADTLTYVQRYIYSQAQFDFENTFVFENSIGGVDTIKLTGELSEVNNPVFDRALFDDATLDYNFTPEKSFEINTGIFSSDRERKWSLDFLNSSQKYFIYDGSLVRVYSEKTDIKSTQDEIGSYSFNFFLSKQSKYLNLQRPADPLPNLEINTDIGEVFFLAPRLNDLPWSNTNDVLIPVQFPYEGFFRKMSLAAIIDSISGGTGGIAQETDPTVPGWVKAIIENDISRWNNTYTKEQADIKFQTATQAGLLYQPLEDQRLSLANDVRFKSVRTSTLVLPSIAPVDLENNEAAISIGGTLSGSYEPSPGGTGYLSELLDVNIAARQDDYVVTWDVATLKYVFKPRGGVSDAYTKAESDARFKAIGYVPAWAEVTGKPTALSQFTNDLGLGSAAYLNASDSKTPYNVVRWDDSGRLHAQYFYDENDYVYGEEYTLTGIYAQISGQYMMYKMNAAAIRQFLSLGSAAYLSPTQIATALDLGTAAYRNYGTGDTQVPLNANITLQSVTDRGAVTSNPLKANSFRFNYPGDTNYYQAIHTNNGGIPIIFDNSVTGGDVPIYIFRNSGQSPILNIYNGGLVSVNQLATTYADVTTMLLIPTTAPTSVPSGKVAISIGGTLL